MVEQKNSKYPPSKWIDAKQFVTNPVNGKFLRFSVSYPEDKPAMIYVSIWRMITPKDGQGNPFPSKQKSGGYQMIGGIALDELPELIRAIEQVRKFGDELLENPPEKTEIPEEENPDNDAPF